MPVEPARSESTTTWVDDAAGLARLASELVSAPSIALDTEQDSFFSYRTKICLIQVAADGREWIVDPLRLRDLSPLAAALADESVPKIAHAADNDLHLLRKEFGLEVRGLFDTMVAASVLGFRKTGLAGLLEEQFGVRLEKRFQRSDWRVRPLSAEQIEYAALDVRHLDALMAFLRVRLEETARVEEAFSEFRRVERVVHEEHAFDPEDYAHVDGARQLDGIGRRILRELFIWRDEIASSEDRAPFRVCGDSALVRLAASIPRDERAISSIPGLPDRFKGRGATPLVERIRDAERLGPLPPPPRRSRDENGPRLSDEQRIVLERLKAWRSRRAAARGVDTGRIAPNTLLLRLVIDRPADAAGLATSGFEPWRIREYGTDVLGVLAES